MQQTIQISTPAIMIQETIPIVDGKMGLST